MPHISKTTYIEFLACPKNTWLKMHKPELMESFELSAFEKSLLANGNLVELWARRLFPGGILIEESGLLAAKKTQELLNQKAPVIFQATFIFENFIAKTDVLEYDNQNDAWRIYEIKGTNTLRENTEERDHIEDASFQYAVARSCGLKISGINIIHLNKDYVRGEEINISELFSIENIDSQILERMERTKEKMNKTAEMLLQDNENALECSCIYKGRSNHCSTFSYSHPEVPSYSVHDIYRIGNGKNKLAKLIEAEIFSLDDLPPNFKASAIQKNQIEVYKTGISIIDKNAIAAELSQLVYPLYFLDYETYPPAIPLFKGFRPYQHIPFQFSLHVLESPLSDLKHYEYLHLDNSDPSLDIIKALKNIIGPEGSVIVWNKTFERDRNKELADRHLEEADFLLSVNERIYDLMDIFQKQYFVHPDFKGKTSIKKILPVLVPELSYQDLAIREGASAMEAWFEKIINSNSDEEKKEVAKNLLNYCRLDTYAMYAIWNEIAKLS